MEAEHEVSFDLDQSGKKGFAIGAVISLLFLVPILLLEDGAQPETWLQISFAAITAYCITRGFRTNWGHGRTYYDITLRRDIQEIAPNHLAGGAYIAVTLFGLGSALLAFIHHS